ncbi:MAG: CDP-alcohol phosphatidyltransferase family protein [Actinomycetota bacterium]|nr:CDP-alcohol phosphatidyltransferase family protein [Actinomycetota bacterium]
MSAVSPAGAPERVEGGLRLATLPNLLSLARLALLAPVLILLDRPEPGSDGRAAAVLFVAGLTDLLDGYLARRRGVVSASGKVVDPIADKVLLGGLVLYLALERGFPVWLVLAILVRDVALILGALFFYRRDQVVFAADWSGKLTTFTMGLLVLAYVIGWRSGYLPLTFLASAALAASYVSYGHRAWAYLSAPHTRSRA